MVIYADVLIILNIITDYFILKLTGAILKNQAELKRMIPASVTGGIFSLSALLPTMNIFMDILLKIAMSFIICLLAFGGKHIKTLLRNTAVFFGVTYLYGGIALSIYLLLKPAGMVINNSVVYFNISPIILIISSTVFYFAFMLLRYLLSKNSKQPDECTVTALMKDKTVHLNGIVDTGNSLCDIFGLSEIIIVNGKEIEDIASTYKNSSRYRIIPVKTVTGTRMLEGYRFDKATIFYGNEEKLLINPILAKSEVPIDGEYNAIINPRSII